MRRIVQLTLACNAALSSSATREKWTTKRVKVADKRAVESFHAVSYVLRSRVALVPDVAAEWDYEANPSHEYPELVAAGSVRPYWWKCRGCGEGYRLSPEARIVRGKGCPSCAAAAAARVSLAAGAAQSSRRALLDGEVNPALKPKGMIVMKLKAQR